VARAEKIRRTIAATPVESGQVAISLTASFGVAACPLHGQQAGQLIERADQALYQAKRGGRDKVRLAEP
jgi:diguanylate cyclase (GGDEF)-like protein